MELLAKETLRSAKGLCGDINPRAPTEVNLSKNCVILICFLSIISIIGPLLVFSSRDPVQNGDSTDIACGAGYSVSEVYLDGLRSEFLSTESFVALSADFLHKCVLSMASKNINVSDAVLEIKRLDHSDCKLMRAESNITFAITDNIKVRVVVLSLYNEVKSDQCWTIQLLAEVISSNGDPVAHHVKKVVSDILRCSAKCMQIRKSGTPVKAGEE